MAVEDHAVFFATLRVMDDKTLFAFFHTLHNANVVGLGFIASAMVALMMQVVHMDAEVRTLICLWKGKVMPARLAVIFIRWNYVVTFILVCIYYFGHVSAWGCNPLIKTIYGLFTALWAAAGAIFLMRIRIIYARECIVNGFFVTLWLCVVGSWVYATTQINSMTLPSYVDFPYSPGCIPYRFPKRAVVGWVASLVFDCSVFFATYIRFHGLRAAKDQRLRSRQWLMQSNLQYFGTSMILNTSLMTAVLLVNDPLLSHMGSAFGFVSQTVMATRLVFHAKGWSSGEGDDDIVLNTFNRNKDRKANGNSMIPHVSFVVDQMIVEDAQVTREDERQQQQQHLRHNSLRDLESQRAVRPESRASQMTAAEQQPLSDFIQAQSQAMNPPLASVRPIFRGFHVPYRNQAVMLDEENRISQYPESENEETLMRQKKSCDSSPVDKADVSSSRSSLYLNDGGVGVRVAQGGRRTSESEAHTQSTVSSCDGVPPPYQKKDS
jgi:hypothetical protein